MVFIITETYATTSVSKHLWTQLETNRGQNPTSQKHVFNNLGGFFSINIGFLGLQSLGFYAEILILAKTSNFSSPYPLILMPIEKSQNDSFTNKQTIFFKSLTSKSFLALYMFMDGDMKKKSLS